MKYRSEIDGLRAVAVVPVILFHSGLEAFSGGFVGVDVFFVISGFLITGIIRAELLAGQFSIVSFYERRARRLLPALFAVVLVCVPFAWFWMLPSEFEAFGNALWSVGVFGSNFLFWRTTGYFGEAAELNPLLHTWSLAVEEQFYVFFPLLLLALRKVRENTLVVLLVVLSTLSLFLAEIMLSAGQASAAFYLLPTRAWELGLGALVSVIYGRLQHGNTLICNLLAALGLGLIVFSILAFDGATPFPGLHALLPVGGTVLILMFARSGTWTATLLSARPLVWIGLISYSAYLWHQPILAFARLRLGHLPDWAPVAVFGLTMLLGYLSWRFVERPFRRRDSIGRASIFSYSAVGTLATIVVGGYIAQASGLPERLPTRAVEIASIADERRSAALGCIATAARRILPQEACRHGNATKTDTALWGDSHANALATQLGKRVTGPQNSMVEFSFANCPPMRNVRTSADDLQCPEHNDRIEQFLLENTDIQTVILIARWSLYFEGSTFNNEEGGIEFGDPGVAMPVETERAIVTAAQRQAELGASLQRQITTLLEAGKEVFVLGPIPEAGWNVPYHLARLVQYEPDIDLSQVTTSAEVYDRRSASSWSMLGSLPNHPKLTILNPATALCRRTDTNRCEIVDGDQPLYRDDDHLSQYGAQRVIREVFPDLEK